MKNLILFLILFIHSLPVFSANIPDDTVNIGIKGSTADKLLIFRDANSSSLKVDHTTGNFSFGSGNNQELKWIYDIGLGANNPFFLWNSAKQKLGFSNDGTLVKDIGSGSGSGGSGGINLLSNSGAEDGTSEWTNTGGTFSAVQYTNGSDDDNQYFRFVATAPGQYVESNLVTVTDNLGFGCMADLIYFQGDNAFTYTVLDSSNNPLSSGDISDLSEGWLKAPTITLKCPDAGETFKLRIESTGAGTIDFDQTYLGSNKNISPIGKGASFIGSIQWDGVAGCLWESSSTGTGPFNVDADCATNPRKTTGEVVDSSSGTQPVFQVPSLKKGIYKVIYEGAIGQQALGVNSELRAQVSIQDGSNTYTTGITRIVGQASGGTEVQIPNLTFTVEVAQDMNNAQINLLGASNVGGSDPFTIYVNNTNLNFKASLFFYPTSSETEPAFTPEQANFEVKGKIFSTNGSNLPGTQASTPNSYASSFLEMELIKGSAQISCNNGEVPSGLTCSAQAEEIGIVVNLPRAGKYEACFNSILYSGGNHQLTHRIYRMNSITDSSYLQGQAGSTIQSVGGTNVFVGDNLCETFDIPSIGKYKFILLQEATNTDTQILVDRNGSSSERDVTFTVKMADHNISRPLIDNQVSTRSRNGAEKGACHVINTVLGAVSFDPLDSDCWFINSIQRFNVGLLEVEFTEPNLKCVATTLNADDKVGITDQSNNRIDAFYLPQTIRSQTILSSGAAVDSSYSIACSKNK